MEPLNGAVFLMPHGNKVLPCFCGEEENTAAAPLFVSVLMLPIQGKDGNMKKLIDFEYDLWTTEDGKCMVRVRLTGEECEVDRETFRLLRAEEKRLRRERMPEKGKGTFGDEMFPEYGRRRSLSLQTICSSENEDGEFWLTDSGSMEEGIVFDLAQKEFLGELTSTQQKVYRLVITNGLSYRDCADLCGVTYQAIQKSIRQIRKKAKIFFG